MQTIPRRAALMLMLGAVAACAKPRAHSRGRAKAEGPAEINALIAKYAQAYDVPEDLVHRVVQRESKYNPGARNGPYYGLMQILPQTAQTMGYDGSAQGLLDAETNLKFGVKYLRGAWQVARGDRDRAVMWYAKGYYYEAKRMGLLEETGLRG